MTAREIDEHLSEACLRALMGFLNTERCKRDHVNEEDSDDYFASLGHFFEPGFERFYRKNGMRV
jgi:hypothetical protein